MRRQQNKKTRKAGLINKGKQHHLGFKRLSCPAFFRKEAQKKISAFSFNANVSWELANRFTIPTAIILESVES